MPFLQPTVKKEAVKVKKEEESSSSTPMKVKTEPLSSQDIKTEADSDDEDNENEYKWWLDDKKDGSVKWTTLRHNGPYFPPPYEPHGVKMKYDGKLVHLSADGEEVATFFAALIDTDYGRNETFKTNFFKDFLNVLAESDPNSPIKLFDKCDFTPITNYLLELKEKKSLMTKEEKKAIKDEKAKLEEMHGWAYLDGRKEKVGNFRIEPPGLFRGRGQHPLTGSLKTRVTPEQVTINIDPDAEVPKAPEGHSWNEVIHDNTVAWLAMWKENVNGNIKYVQLAANSSLKGQSDMKKFEKARKLKGLVGRIREDYTAELKDKVMATRQRATALYFIDRLALRAGNEKGEDEADTVGCCSLRYEHISLEPPNKVIFDFLGKDSIRYYNEVEVDPVVYKNISIFKRDPKTAGDPLFDRLSTTLMNAHLKSYMDGLTAKVFRTYNASHTFEEELKKTPVDGTVAEKILAYNRANRQVAILCNHQRAVPKAHETQLVKLKEKILGMKYERMKIKAQMIELDPDLENSRPELLEVESDLDEEFIERYEQELKEKEEAKQKEKLEKENEKRKQEGLSPMKALPERPKPEPRLDQLEKKYDSVCDRIATQKTNMIDKVTPFDCFYVIFVSKTNRNQFYWLYCRMRTKQQRWEHPRSIILIRVFQLLGVTNTMSH